MQEELFPPPGDPGDDPVPIPKGTELTVYRIVKTDDPDAADYEESFKSHAELGLPPRGRELEHSQLYEGISVYEAIEQAAEVARRWPVIGAYVARMTVSAAQVDARVLRWGPQGHLTLWGNPLMLSRTTTEIHPVQAL